MKILNIQVLKGPNYWSNFRKKLIVLNLDLEKYEQLPSNVLKGFNNALKQLIPSMYEHRCSIGSPGGFFSRLDQGTWLGHVIEHVALELQFLAGMNCGFGRTYSTNQPGVYHVIFSYEIESAGIYAAKAAVKLVDALASGAVYSELENNIKDLRALCEGEQLGPSTQAIVDEALKRNIPVQKIKDNSLIILGQGCNQKKMWATVSSQTSSIALDIASNKDLTKNILEASFIPTPQGVTVQSLEELDKALTELGFPLVIKPLDGNHGRGILTHINSKEKAIVGFELAKQISNSVIVERWIKGDDYRFLVINYKLVAVAKRTPAMIKGTGTHTIQELINLANADPKRGLAHENVLTTIKIDEITLSILLDKNLHLDSILPANEIIYLKGTANLSSGGTATDVTDLVHPENVRLVEQVARLINLDICGIDVIAETISHPINHTNGAVIEVNAGPGLRMHLSPTIGKPRNVAAPILDMLYPQGKSATIPVVAVTGTNGKTTVVRLIAHFAKKANHYVGFTTTEGIYKQDNLVYSGDCSGPLSAAAILSDPLIDFAVLECARGGILRAGLGFDECDVSIITNVTSDHLGLHGIDSLEELARVKAVLAYSTKKTGYAILNADDEFVYALKDELFCQVALFGIRRNERIEQHCFDGGLASYIEDDFIIIQDGETKNYLAKVSDIPITLSGIATCMVQNILPAVLAGIVSDFSIKEMSKALYELLPTSENLPGRMNIFNFNNFQLMIDYAHNEGAYIELKHYFNKINNKRKIGIISATGDRRPADIQKIGYYAAQIFDEIIIKHDKEGRGSTNEQLTDLIKEGITNSQCCPQVLVISDEFEAVHHAIKSATPETFIFYAPEDVFAAINFIKKEQKKNASKSCIAERAI